MPISVHVSFTRIHGKRYAGRQASVEWDFKQIGENDKNVLLLQLDLEKKGASYYTLW